MRSSLRSWLPDAASALGEPYQRLVDDLARDAPDVFVCSEDSTSIAGYGRRVLMPHSQKRPHVGLWVEGAVLSGDVDEDDYVVKDGLLLELSVALRSPTQIVDHVTAVEDLRSAVERYLPDGAPPPTGSYPNNAPRPVGVPTLLHHAATIPGHQSWTSDDWIWVTLCVPLDCGANDEPISPAMSKTISSMREIFPKFRALVDAVGGALNVETRREVTLQEVLGWCGEYVVHRAVRDDFHWLGGFAEVDFTAKEGAGVIEVKSSFAEPTEPYFSVAGLQLAFQHCAEYRLALVGIERSIVESIRGEVVRAPRTGLNSASGAEWSRTLATVSGRGVDDILAVKSALLAPKKELRTIAARFIERPFEPTAFHGLRHAVTAGIVTSGSVRVRI